jgi:hypothetical protein
MTLLEGILICITLIVALVLTSISASKSGAGLVQKQAIRAGVGEYVLNPTNGASTFQFKTNLVAVEAK